MVIKNDLENNDSITNGDDRLESIAKPKFDGDIQSLFDITILRPVVAFPFSLQPCSSHLSLIGHGWYLLTGTRPSVIDAFPKDTIRACMILWAQNNSAAVLASRSEDSLKEENGDDNDLPPVEFFIPTSTSWTYGEILRAGRGKLMESAVYGSNGEFQFKQVRLNKSHLYYPSRKRIISEVPIAISLTGRSEGSE